MSGKDEAVTAEAGVVAGDEFREQVRHWLQENCPASMRTPPGEGDLVFGGRTLTFSSDDQRLWFERMRDRGWFAPHWPSEYGGGGLDPGQARILEQEMQRLHCRPPQINLGIWMLGPVLLEFGNEAQKREHLPNMTRGEIRWCQGFSEPNAGSDLASLVTRARLDGDHYVVNGSKMWTSYADQSDWMYCIVRTGVSEPKHQGISLLLIDLASPGVSVQPIELISGKSNFCQVFFDAVRVPRENVVGPVDGGWTVAKRLLQHEREAMSRFGADNVPGDDLLGLAREYLGVREGRLAQPVLRDAIADCLMDEHAFGLTQQRVGEEARLGLDINAASASFKYVGTELHRKRYELIMAVLGQRGLGWEGGEFSEAELKATRHWLLSYTMTIAGGTSEVQLNVIAKRVLGLPG